VLDPDDETPDDPNVILPDDEGDAERARADIKRQAAELPAAEDDVVVTGNPNAGHGDLMGAEGQQGTPANPEAEQGDEGVKNEGDKQVAGATSKPATKPGTTRSAAATKASTTRK
jgi:hypothetical protein